MISLPLPDARSTTQAHRIGRYEVLAKVASGGMATVYVGRATGALGFSRVVALKRLHPHLAAEPDFVRMFLDEARIAAGIRHPNVVATLDVDDSDGLSLVMEYVDGVSLLELTRAADERHERVPVPVALRITLDLLAGLQAAHDLVDEQGRPAGVVHRDVSPHNVLVDRAGAARITDFGVARATSRHAHTRDGRVKGKLAYMAPEQVSGDAFDHRVDVFAAGVVAWELLQGRRLFEGATDAKVLHALLYAPVPALDRRVPRAVAAAVMRALDRDPARRFDSCSAFAEALEAAAPGRHAVASARAVASLVARYDSGERERFRASLPSLPDGLDPASARASGVVRRVSEAPECSFDEVALDDASSSYPTLTTGDLQLVEDAPATPPEVPAAARRWPRVGAVVAGACALAAVVSLRPPPAAPAPTSSRAPVAASMPAPVSLAPARYTPAPARLASMPPTRPAIPPPPPVARPLAAPRPATPAALGAPVQVRLGGDVTLTLPPLAPDPYGPAPTGSTTPRPGT